MDDASAVLQEVSTHEGEGPGITFRQLDSLKGYEFNARTHSPEQVRQVATSIVEFGWTVPVLEDATGIVAGHARCEAADLLYTDVGCELHFPNGKPIPFGCVPTLRCDGWSKEKRRAYIIVDNKLAENAGWDEEILRPELLAVQESGLDDLLGFSGKEWKDLFGAKSESEYSRAVKAPIYEPTQETPPPIADLCDRTKMDALVADIDASTCTAGEKEFLRLAAARHAVFDYRNIAEAYAHAGPELQRLMEHSALVIIDFHQAIELGFVRLSCKLAAMVGELDQGEDVELDDPEGEDDFAH